ncbi:armadillo-type protein [Globomyces pollinis-pini]|nr:armadillo-type protein [Globomyces pollinis-pini]
MNKNSIENKGFCDITLKPRPRRRADSSGVDGLDILIQKTKAIGLRGQEDGLAAGEDGNKWLNALSTHGPNLLWGVTKIRKYVCGEGSDERVQELIQFRVLDRLLYFLDGHTDPDVIFETLWIVTNIAAGPTSHTTILVDMGYLPYLGRLLQHELGPIRTQAAWAIGNIIGDREGYRDLILQNNLLPLILNIWKVNTFDTEAARVESKRISFWIVDNMCRYKPDWHLMKPALDFNHSYINHRICWAIARVLHQSGRNLDIDSIVTQDMCNRMVEILRTNCSLTTHPILRALINMACSKNSMHLQYIVNANVLPVLEYYLRCDGRLGSRGSYELFAIQILGNLASKEIYAVEISQYESLTKWLVENLEKSKDQECRNELCITIRNMLYHRNLSVSGILIKFKILRHLNSFLNRVVSNSKIQLIALEAIHHFSHTPFRCRSDYLAEFQKLGLFSSLVEIYTAASGQYLDEMDHDDNDVVSEPDSDDEGWHAPQAENVAIPFHVTNPNNPNHPHFFNQQSTTSNLSVKEKIAARSLSMMRELYPQEFESAVQAQHSNSELSASINSITFGAKNPVDDLSQIMLGMKTGVPKAGSEVTLGVTE